MLTMRLDAEEGVQIGDGPSAGAVIKVLRRSGRKVELSILTNLRVVKMYFGLNPPAFAPGLAGAVARPMEVPKHAMSCVNA